MALAGLLLANGAVPAKKPAPAPKHVAAHQESESEEEEEKEGWEEHYVVLAEFSKGASIPARFRNPAQAPVVIVEARVPLSSSAVHEHSATTLEPAVKLENRSARTVVAVRLRYKAEPGSQKIGKYELRLRPGRKAVIVRPQYEIWGEADSAKVQVLGVRFAGGREWGNMDSQPNPRHAWVPPLKP